MVLLEALPVVPLAWTLVHSLWQLTLVAGVLAVVLAMLGRRTNLRYLAAGIALSLMLALPVATFVRLAQPEVAAPTGAGQGLVTAGPRASVAVLPVPAGAPAQDAEIESEPPDPRQQMAVGDTPPSLDSMVERYGSVLVVAWLVGVGLLLVRLLGGLLVLRRLRSRGMSVAPLELQRLLAELGHRLGLRGGVQLRISSLVDVPLVVGVVKPLVLLPVGAVSGLPQRDLELLLAHELAHVRRFDLVVNAVQRVVEVLLYFHPAVWWVSGVMRAEREHACDELAVQVTGGDRVAYASALARLAEARAAPVLAAGAAGGSLLARVERLVGRAPGRQGPAAIALLVGVLLVSALLVSGLAQEQADAGGVGPDGFRSVWATVSPGVEFERNFRDIEEVQSGSYLLLEERWGGELLWRALVAHDSLSGEEAAMLAPGVFTSKSALRVLHQGAGYTVWLQEGSITGVEQEPLDWFSSTLDRVVLAKLRESRLKGLSPGQAGWSVVTSTEDEFESLVYGEFREHEFFRELQGGPDLGDNRRTNEVRLAAHALAHGLEDEAVIDAYLLDVLRVVDDVDQRLAEDFLRVIPEFTPGAFKLELLEGLAQRVGTLPPDLEDEFEAAAESVPDEELRDRALRVFEPGYEFELRAGLRPFWFSFGTFNRPEFAESGGSGWFAALGGNGYADRTGVPVTITDPYSNVIFEEELTSDYLRTSKTRDFQSKLRSGIYTLSVEYLGREYRVEVEVDAEALLPSPQNVRVLEEEPGRPVIVWDPVPGARYYEVEIDNGSGGYMIFDVEEPRLDVLSQPSTLEQGTRRVEAIRAFTRRPDCGACAVHVSQSSSGPTFELTVDPPPWPGPQSDEEDQQERQAAPPAAQDHQDQREIIGTDLPTTLWVTLVTDQVELEPQKTGLEALGDFELVRIEERAGNGQREAVVRKDPQGGFDIQYREDWQGAPLDQAAREWLTAAVEETTDRLAVAAQFEDGIDRLKEESSDEDPDARQPVDYVLDPPHTLIGNAGFRRYYSIEVVAPGTGTYPLEPAISASPDRISMLHHRLAHGLAELTVPADEYASALRSDSSLSRDAELLLARLLNQFSERYRNSSLDLQRATLVGEVMTYDDYGRLAAIAEAGHVVLDEYRDGVLVRAMVIRGSPLEFVVFEPNQAGVLESPYGPLTRHTLTSEELPAELRAWYSTVFANTVTNLYRQTPAADRSSMTAAWDVTSDRIRVSLEVVEDPGRFADILWETGRRGPVLQLAHEYSHGLLAPDELRQALTERLRSQDLSLEQLREIRFVIEQLYPDVIFPSAGPVGGEGVTEIAFTLLRVLDRFPPDPWQVPGRG